MKTAREQLKEAAFEPTDTAIKSKSFHKSLLHILSLKFDLCALLLCCFSINKTQTGLNLYSVMTSTALKSFAILTINKQ